MKKHQSNPVQLNELQQKIALLEVQLENERKMVKATQAHNEVLRQTLDTYRQVKRECQPLKAEWKFFEN